MSVQKKTTTIANQLLQARSTASDIAHRLEFVDEINGVRYINDSKATDLDSTWYSLECINKPLIWVVGTSEVEEDFSEVIKWIGYKVKTVICLGKNASWLRDKLEAHVDHFLWVHSMQEVVTTAAEYAKSGDVVLFSPACSSFEFYNTFIERGNAFKNEVAQLKDE